MNVIFNRTQIFSAVIIIAVVAAWLMYRHEQIQDAVFEHNKSAMAQFIQSRARALLNPQEFISADSAAQQEAFQSFFEAIQSPQVMRMKVWDGDFKVIWSDLTGLIGQRFPDNHEVKEALEGHIKFEVEKEKDEHVSERASLELAELYVPIADAKGQIVGVLEIYQSTARLDQEISSQFRMSAFLALPLAGMMIGGLLFASRFMAARTNRSLRNEHGS